MNVLMLSLMYPEDMKTQVARRRQRQAAKPDQQLPARFAEVVKRPISCRTSGWRLPSPKPVGVFPLQYRRLLIPSGWHDEHAMYELGCINLPGMKQYGRDCRAARKLSAWCAQDPSNRMVLLYTMYLPYLQAVERVRRRYPT